MPKYNESPPSPDYDPQIIQLTPDQIKERQAHQRIERVLNEGMELDFGTRWRLITEDPLAAKGLRAYKNVLGNAAVVAADFVPVIGEVPAALNTAIKMFPGGQERSLTPNVSFIESLAWQLGTAPVELGTGSLAPSHIAEAGKQIAKDIKEGNFAAGKNALAYLFTGKTDYLRELNDQRERLDQASSLFLGSQQEKK